MLPCSNESDRDSKSESESMTRITAANPSPSYFRDHCD